MPRAAAICSPLSRVLSRHWMIHYLNADMVGNADSLQLPHSPRVRAEMNTPENWGYFSPQAEARLQNMMGLQMKPLVDDVKHYSDICMFTGGPVIGYVWQSQAAGTTWQSSVRTAYPSTVALVHLYGPCVWVTALSSTADDVDA